MPVIMQDFTRFADQIRESEKVFAHRMERVGEEIGKHAVRFYQSTTTSWDHPVEFEYSVRTLGYIMHVNAGTQDLIYHFVDKGTQGPYPIVPKGPWPLLFRAGYAPKTTPGYLSSKRGGASGPKVAAWAVMHPGIEARKFSDEIRKNLEPQAIRLMEADIRLWAAQYWG